MAIAIEPTLARGPETTASDKSFGFVFTAVFALYGGWPLVHANPPRFWALTIAAGFAIIALIKPQILHPLNRVWMGFGALLHRILSPVIMSLIFFLCVTPIGWIMRLRGIDLLSRNRNSKHQSYWITLDGPSPSPESFKNQF